MGIAHPTGYPLYLLIGGAWQRLLDVLGISPARALNAFNALTGAVAVCLTFLVVRRWLVGPLIVSRIAALFAVVHTLQMLHLFPLFLGPVRFWRHNRAVELKIAKVQALLAYLLALGDGGAAAMAAGGLLGGAMISRYRLRSGSCLARFTPTVSRQVIQDA